MFYSLGVAEERPRGRRPSRRCHPAPLPSPSHSGCKRQPFPEGAVKEDESTPGEIARSILETGRAVSGRDSSYAGLLSCFPGRGEGQRSGERVRRPVFPVLTGTPRGISCTGAAIEPSSLSMAGLAQATAVLVFSCTG